MWQGILGHDDVVERFRRAIARGRLVNTFLFVGPRASEAYVGLEAWASASLSRAADRGARSLRRVRQLPASRCPDASRFAVDFQAGRQEFIPVAQIIGDDQHRMRAGLCHDIALRAFSGAARWRSSTMPTT